MGRGEFQLDPPIAMKMMFPNRSVPAWPSLAASLALAMGTVIAGAHPIEWRQDWSVAGVAGWESVTPSVTLSNPGGYLRQRFAAQSTPRMEFDRMTGALPGTLWVTNVSFRFRTEGRAPGALRLVLQAENGRRWQLNLPDPAGADWQTYSIPVAYTPDWHAGPGSTDDMFREDRRVFTKVGVYVRRQGLTSAQVYDLDDVVVQGFATSPGDRDGDGIPDEWELTHGLDTDNPLDGAEDDDGDGMSNYAEWRAGTDPRDPSSVLALAIDRAAVAGPELRWHSVPDRTYAVWRALSLLETNFLLLDAGILADPPTNVYPDFSATNFPAAYYIIEVEP